MVATLVQIGNPGHPLAFPGQPVGLAGATQDTGTFAAPNVQASNVRRKPRMRVFDVTLGVYATGGVAISAQDIGVGPTGTIVACITQPKAGYIIRWDEVAGKLMAFRNTAAAVPLVQETNAVDLSAVTVRCLFFAYA